MIITINREFGSGGRELGKRLADALHVPCYDHQIIEMIANEQGLNEEYVANVGEKCIEASYPLTIGHRLAMMPLTVMDQTIRVASAQRALLEKFATQGDCVIVGRCADVILKEHNPLNIFVYADMASKVERCMRRAPEGENMTRAEMEREIRRIDKERAQYHAMYADTKWGSREGYHLCVNTSFHEIKKLVPSIAQFCKDWFAEI